VKLVDLATLFEITYGVNIDLNKLKKSRNGINYVSRTQNNNGVTEKVEVIQDKQPNPGGTISVSGGGSVLESFYQEEPYYSGRDLFYLTPKVKMTKHEMLFYCMCIRANKYKYNFQRQPNKSLGKIKLPSKESIPEWINDVDIMDLSHLSKKFDNDNVVELDIKKWKHFKLYPDLFEMESGKYYPSTSFNEGNTPLISSTEANNGTTKLTDLIPEYQSNCITIGKVSCSAFYQKQPFCATADVTVLVPKFKMNIYNGLFISIVINQEGFKWNYGRQIRLSNCKDLVIELPFKIDEKRNHVPHFEYMENFIKTMHFSKNI